jgi:hypothetical protein
VKSQSGLTLVELALVLVIVGLLIGGLIAGQELITGARVRSLLAQQDGVQTAYFGFISRYGSPPGDYAKANTTIPGIDDATEACGLPSPNRGNGDGNQRIGLTNGEFILAWEHLSRAGFLTGSYTCSGNTAVTQASVPINPYGQYLQLIYDSVYAGAGGMTQHNLKTGGQVPSYILGEADRKIDDGNALLGSFRGSTYTTGDPTDPTCWYSDSGAWSSSAVNCSAARLF